MLQSRTEAKTVRNTVDKITTQVEFMRALFSNSSIPDSPNQEGVCIGRPGFKYLHSSICFFIFSAKIFRALIY